MPTSRSVHEKPKSSARFIHARDTDLTPTDVSSPPPPTPDADPPPPAQAPDAFEGVSQSASGTSCAAAGVRG